MKPPQHIRIIGGQFKRSKLPVADKPGLRPTPDRVRETLFNWLGQDLRSWRCMDVFAGTGALGLEAASRGAASVLLVEQDKSLVQSLSRSTQQLQAHQVQIQQGDGIRVLQQQAASSLDLIFLDPPFAAGLFETALQHCVRALQPSGWVYLEAPRSWSDAELAPFQLCLYRQLQAGAVHAHLLRPLPSA